MTKPEIIEALEASECLDGFACPFGMYGQNKAGAWGCFAKYPNGDPSKQNEGCVAHQAAMLLKAERKPLEEKR